MGGIIDVHWPFDSALGSLRSFGPRSRPDRPIDVLGVALSEDEGRLASRRGGALSLPAAGRRAPLPRNDFAPQLSQRGESKGSRVRHEDSKSHLLKLPVILQNSAHGERIIDLDAGELRSYLELDEASVNRLTSRFRCRPSPVVRFPRSTREQQAEEFRTMLETCEARSKSDIARITGVSRAWVTKVMKLR